MLCGNCKKNQATKTYEQIKKGKKTVDYYCMDCYARLFITPTAKDDGEGVCPYCGTTAEEVKKRNLVGCAKCYQTLESVLYPIVTKFQGGKAHDGKKPQGGEKERLERRRHELQTIADKRMDEGDWEGARAYTKRISDVENGKILEDFVWDNHSLSKQS